MITLAIGDQHAPYHHPDTLDFLATVKREWKPDRVINLGDEADRHRLSTHPQESDALDAKRELRRAKKYLKDLAKLFPHLLLCTSNHVDDRRNKAARRSNLDSSELKSWAETIEAPATWRWANHWRFEKVVYFHGTQLRGVNTAQQAIQLWRSNVVYGHWHTHAYVQYMSRGNWTNWAMAAGCLIDEHSAAFRYTTNAPMIGSGIVYDGIPIHIPMKGVLK